MSNLDKLNTQVLGVSTQSIESHRKFAAAQKLNFPILADVGGKVAKRYGVLQSNGGAQRVTFTINAEGLITAINQSVNVKTHGADMVRACTLPPKP